MYIITTDRFINSYGPDEKVEFNVYKIASLLSYSHRYYDEIISEKLKMDLSYYRRTVIKKFNLNLLEVADTQFLYAITLKDAKLWKEWIESVLLCSKLGET